jgi:hypothetical protein
MRILWISPKGDGWSLAASLRKEGAKVVYFCPDPHNKRADGVLPRATASNWKELARKADQIYVDGNFQSRRTRRSWAPSTWIEDIKDVVREYNKEEVYAGPTPTTELLQHDTRYLKKVLKRVGLTWGDPSKGETLWLHTDARGTTHLELQEKGASYLVPSAPMGSLLYGPGKLLIYLREMGYKGPVSYQINPEGGVCAVKASFTYPTAFGQAHLQLEPKGGEVAEIVPLQAGDPVPAGMRVWAVNAWKENDTLKVAGIVGYATKLR